MNVFRTLKKALILQGLFLCPYLWAQALIIKQPTKNQALENPQTVELEVVGGEPTRVSLFLNGKRIKARRKPPFTFQINWNTSLSNELKAVAQFADAEPVSVSRRFEQIKVDQTETVDVFHCFPMPNRPIPKGGLQLRASGNTVQPRVVDPAARFRMDLVIALDVSGSMSFSIPVLEPGLRALSAHAQSANWRLRLLAFDDAPRLVDGASWPDQLKDLSAGKGKSVVYDTIATATRLFDRGPRRMILLISDGADDGGEHNLETAGIYLKNANAVLVWLNPTGYQNTGLVTLARDSGGDSLRGEPNKIWPELATRLNNQLYLEAPGAAWPIQLKAAGTDIWFPRWK